MPGGAGTGARESYRPPWVRGDAAAPAGAPADGKPAWALRKRSTTVQDDVPTTSQVEEQLANAKASLKKQTVRPKAENGVTEKKSEPEIEKPVTKTLVKDRKAAPEAKKPESKVEPVKLKKVDDTKKVEEPPKKTEDPPASSKRPPIAKQSTINKDDVGAKKPPVLQRQSSKDDSAPVKKWRDPLIEKVKEGIDKTINEIPKGHTLTKNESLRSLLKPVPMPPPPPMPPKLPPPPEFKKAPITPDKIKRIEALKSRPRRRPDWSDMMKEVESGKKLNHVVCNDRSSPIITKEKMVKAKGQYVYESEKGNMHNQLLKQIGLGVKLKTVKTNDRSKPNLDGLRKFRRQMTIEEQIQKSQSQANLAEVKETPVDEDEVDEMDDIDKVRDDLQSTKQLLALELRNKEAQQRENKRLQGRITNLEAELKSERAHVKQDQAKTVISVVDAYDETLVTSLKREVTETKRVADDLQKKYHRAAEELDEVQSELEEMKRKNAELEKKLEQALKGYLNDEEEEQPLSYYQLRQKEFQNQCNNQGIMPNSNNNSRRPSRAVKQQSVQKSDTEEEEEESSGEEGEDEEAKVARRTQREIKMLGNKIKNTKEKKEKARQERAGLKVQLKNQQQALKVERKKYKVLKKEVDKMANMMKEHDEDDEDEDDEDEEDEKEAKKTEEEASEEEETESESEEETESETESESEEEDAPIEKKKENLAGRVKKHETSLNALKKGNYLIIANIDRLKDDVSNQKEMSASLQEDLDSVLAELE